MKGVFTGSLVGDLLLAAGVVLVARAIGEAVQPSQQTRRSGSKRKALPKPKGNSCVYGYELYDGSTLVYVGISKDPYRREREHMGNKDFTNMRIVKGPVTRKTARKWEKGRIATYERNHHGFAPQYNFA